MAELESDRYEALLEGLDYFDSPVNKYLLTKRLTLDWERIENIMQHDSGKSNVNHIYCIIHNLHLHLIILLVVVSFMCPKYEIRLLFSYID